ncbi:hypothetical protein L6R53_20355 [Myxococcota bacterium]|nr:hypothetical protein [Myxococcota bacterium]
MTLPRSSTLALLALLLPAPAFAGDAVVPPLVAKGVDPLVNLNLTSLISSEADFLGVFDNVNQLETPPATLNTSCLASTACLYKIAKDNGATGVIAGQATPGGGKYEFKLIFYDADKNRIVRTVSFTLPDSPAAIADGMGGYVKEVVTGTAPATPESSTLSGFDDADLYEDDDFAAVGASPGNSRRIPTSSSGGRALTDDFSDRRAEDEARARAEAEARARAEEEAAAERARAAAEAKRRADEQAAAERARAEAQRRAEEEEEAAAAAAAARRGPSAAMAAAEEEDEEDFENFTLSSSTTVVGAGASATAARTPPPADDEEDDLSFLADDSRSSSSSSRSTSSSSSSSSRTSSSTSSSRYDDLDEEPRSSSRSSSSSSRSSSSSSRSTSDRDSSARVDRDEDKDAKDSSVLLAGRLGFAPYQGLGFVTYGAEVGYLVAGGLAIAGGIEAYSVQRTIPPDQLEAGESARQWNTILPLNIGLQYHIGQSKVRPYLGAEMLVVPGIVRGSSTPAMGGRGRLGANFFVADSVALNLNGAIGFLGGKDITTIEDGMDNGAVSPQVSGGTVLFF